MDKEEEKVKAADKWILSQENGYEFRVRDVFVAGYEQAKKDLALTWEDIHRLAIIEDNLIHELCIKDDTIPTTKSFYEEVLKRYKEVKK